MISPALQLPAAVEAWTGHDTQLLVVAALGIALIVVLIAKFKLHPFLALVLGSAFVGLASGVELAKIRALKLSRSDEDLVLFKNFLRLTARARARRNRPQALLGTASLAR